MTCVVNVLLTYLLAYSPACSLGRSTARFYVACIVLAIEHLHKHFICFRDLKPENLLVSPPLLVSKLVMNTSVCPLVGKF